MSTILFDPFFKEVSRYAVKGEGWAHMDIPLWRAEQKSLQLASPTQKADALVLCVQYALSLGKRDHAVRIAAEAAEAIECLEPAMRDMRAMNAIDLFIEQVDAFKAAMRLARAVNAPESRAKACVGIGFAAVGSEDVGPWVKEIRALCESGTIDEPKRSMFLQEADLILSSAAKYRPVAA
jgi:hypothetical protein